jgi:hypothetical protein
LLVGLLGGGIALWLWPGGGQGEKPPPESSVASSTPAAPDKPSPEGNRPTNPPPAPPQSAPAATQPPPSPEGGGATPSTTTIPPTPAPPKDKPAGGGSNTGDLFVSITTVPPGAQITFDNNTGQACVAPCNFTLTAGRHTIQAKLDGYRPAMRIFELPKEQNVTVNLDKQQGTLRVTTEPAGATVLINGQKQGQPTPAVLTLAPGKYKIELVRDGYQTYTDEVTVRDQAIGQLNISLPKNP